MTMPVMGLDIAIGMSMTIGNTMMNTAGSCGFAGISSLLIPQLWPFLDFQPSDESGSPFAVRCKDESFAFCQAR